MTFTLTICGLVLLSGSPALAQRAIDLTGTPAATISQPFTTVTGVRELPGNVAIVTDQFERRVFLVDFGSGTARQIGRQGDGPGEYRFPMAPLPAPANATWIFDATLRRIHVLSPDGMFTTTVAPPVGRVRVPGGILAMRGTDRTGRLYFEGNSFDSETGQFLDSIAILRWNPQDDRITVLGRVWSGGRVIVDRPPIGRMSIAREATPFPHVDAWIVLPDGRVAIVEHETFRIVFLEEGGIFFRGPSIRYTPIPTTASDRAVFRERNAQARMVAAGGGQSVRAVQPLDAEFPRTMPPFIASTVVSSPEGEIWIGRSHALTDRTWRYEVFDARGQLIATATLPANSVIVGFGNGVVYVGRTDPADDLVYLERYRR